MSETGQEETAVSSEAGDSVPSPATGEETKESLHVSCKDFKGLDPKRVEMKFKRFPAEVLKNCLKIM